MHVRIRPICKYCIWLEHPTFHRHYIEARVMPPIYTQTLYPLMNLIIEIKCTIFQETKIQKT